jgi:hypothetical protein
MATRTERRRSDGQCDAAGEDEAACGSGRRAYLDRSPRSLC